MPDVRRAAKLGWAKTALFCMLPVVTLLLAGEMALRVYAACTAEARVGRALPSPRQRLAYQLEDSVLGYSLKPDYNVGGIRINALGFRGPEVSATKGRGSVRIVAIGDSCTFGLAGEACPYPAQLQKLMREHGGGAAPEVINAGVEGYSSEYGLRLLESRISTLLPDIVTIYIGWNDLYTTDPHQRHAPEPAADGLSGPQGPPDARLTATLRRALDHLYLVQHLRRTIYLELPRLRGKVQGEQRVEGHEIHPAMTDAYAARLTQIVRTARAMDARPVVMTLPTILSGQMSDGALALVHYPGWAEGDHRYFLRVVNAFNEAIRTVARDEGAVLIDNALFVDRMGREGEALFFDTLHMYCRGYELLAQNIYRELARNALIP
jgi:lysophospholipase L1-like esterase